MKNSKKSINSSFRDAHKTLLTLLQHPNLNPNPNPNPRPQSSASKTSSSRPGSRFLQQKYNETPSIDQENSRLTQKLSTIRSSFSVKSWEKDYKKSRKYISLKQKRFCPGSKQSLQRPLLESYNFVSYL